MFSVQSHCSVIRWNFAPLAEDTGQHEHETAFSRGVCGKYKGAPSRQWMIKFIRLGCRSSKQAELIRGKMLNLQGSDVSETIAENQLD